MMLTYRAECYCGGSQANQATVACMRLMDSISIVVAKLIEDGIDFDIVLGGDQLTNGTLQAGRANLCKSRVSIDRGYPRKVDAMRRPTSGSGGRGHIKPRNGKGGESDDDGEEGEARHTRVLRPCAYHIACH